MMPQIATGIDAVINDASPLKSSVPPKNHHQSTLAIHADDDLNRTTDVSPALHVSTTFRYGSNPDDLITAAELVVGPLLDCSRRTLS